MSDEAMTQPARGGHLRTHAGVDDDGSRRSAAVLASRQSQEQRAADRGRENQCCNCCGPASSDRGEESLSLPCTHVAGRDLGEL
jgi:hypothetical protein